MTTMYMVYTQDGKAVCGADTKDEAIKLAHQERPDETLIGVIRDGKREVGGFFIGRVPF